MRDSSHNYKEGSPFFNKDPIMRAASISVEGITSLPHKQDHPGYAVSLMFPRYWEKFMRFNARGGEVPPPRQFVS